MACVSCVSTTFFQPAWSGSHLYSANRNTLRSGHWESVLLALVGAPLWGCRSLAFCTLSIPYFRWFVKRFFQTFLIFFRGGGVGDDPTLPPSRLARFVPCGLLPVLCDYSIADRITDCNRQNAQNTGFLHPHLCALYILTKLLAAWYNGNSAQGARRRAANFSTF